MCLSSATSNKADETSLVSSSISRWWSVHAKKNFKKSVEKDEKFDSSAFQLLIVLLMMNILGLFYLFIATDCTRTTNEFGTFLVNFEILQAT